MIDNYYAKSKNENGEQKTVQHHLMQVAALARIYGDEIGVGNEAELTAQMHDFGKYSDSFQRVLQGQNQNCDHAICGAVMLSVLSKKNSSAFPMVEAINGHHDGLEYAGALEDKIKQIWKANPGTDVEGNNRKFAALVGCEQYQKAWECFRNDFPDFQCKKIKRFQVNPNYDGFSRNIEAMLYTRMIFSCLVDADYSASASDDDPDYLANSEYTKFSPKQLLEKLYQYMDGIRSASSADDLLNQMRDEVFEKCGDAGEMEEGLFTLTAPTGLGKTLAMLHFALRHCAKHNKRRIIIVLPFLTLAEQNTATYAEIVPDILIDHSQSDLTDEQREFAERWRFPFIITTSVNFFETLFSDKPADCRKLHHIANSVVMFDEVQSLPIELTESTLHAAKELCDRYHTTMVFSSATQPEYNKLAEMKKVGWNPTEILPDHAKLYDSLRRTKVEWRLEGSENLACIAEEMSEMKSVCAIVNLRKHARKLFHELASRCQSSEIFFLTTDMCPQHRMKTVEMIKYKLKEKLPCRVVATQCIEAGIDLDFETLYRALAPLDSIIQAAGRCNRNGRLGEGKVIVFIPDQLDEKDRRYPSDWYQNAALEVKRMSMDREIDIYDPERIKEYYCNLFKRAEDKETLKEAVRDHSYERVKIEYKMIETYGYRIIVPFGKSYCELRKELTERGINGRLMRETAPFTVTTALSRGKNIEEFAEPVYMRKNGRVSKVESGYYLLRAQHEKLYCSDMGLQFPEETIFQAIW